MSPVSGTRLVSSVERSKVTWLWPGRLPRGKLCVLDGDPGLGKSTMLLDLAARVSTGGPMPGSNTTFPASSVVVMSAEDGAGDTIRPRLEAARADLDRVVLFEEVVDDSGATPGASVGATPAPAATRPPQLPYDVPVLAEVVREHGACLVIIDPLAAYLTGVDSYKDSDVRKAMHPLKTLAETTGAAIVVLRHLSKTGGSNPLYRGGGSIGIIGAARAGLLVAKDPEDDTRRIVAVTKSNLGVEPPALAYRLVGDPEHDVARVTWEGTTAHKASDLLVTRDEDEHHGARDEAAEFLRDLLADGPVPAKEAMTRARQAGISTITLKRAKKTVGVRSEKRGRVGEPGQWSWVLDSTPEGDHETPKGLTPESTIPFGNGDPLRVEPGHLFSRDAGESTAAFRHLRMLCDDEPEDGDDAA